MEEIVEGRRGGRKDPEEDLKTGKKEGKVGDFLYNLENYVLFMCTIGAACCKKKTW